MTYVENLIRLYYFYHGSFDNIRTCNFSDSINKAFANSNYDVLNNYLYNVLGYKNTSVFPASTVHSVRKDFCINSYKKSYISELCKTYKCSGISELVDLLEMRGMLGIQRKHLSNLGSYSKCGIPSKFLNIQVKESLEIISKYLDRKYLRKNLKFIDLKKNLLLERDIKSKLKEYEISYSDFFNIHYVEGLKYPYFIDNTLFIKRFDNYSEEELREILVHLYCLGMPTLPLYLRDEFISLLPRVLTFNSSDESLLRILDISYVAETSVRGLLEIFGFSLPDPEVMWKKYNGYLTYYDGKVLYTNPSSLSFIEYSMKEFLDLYNSGKLEMLDIQIELINQEMNKMKISEQFSDL